MGLTSDHCIGRGLRKDVKELKGKFHQGSDQPVHSVGASLECGLYPRSRYCLWLSLLLFARSGGVKESGHCSVFLQS